jgi:hypothetical protein
VPLSLQVHQSHFGAKPGVQLNTMISLQKMMALIKKVYCHTGSS